MKIIISIKPEYAFRIFDGSKRFEFRKTMFANEIKTALIYATMPLGKVMGEFEVKNIIVENPANLWEMTKKYAGVDRKSFDEYFYNRKSAVAIEIGSVCEYKLPLELHEIQHGLRAPQSFSYLK